MLTLWPIAPIRRLAEGVVRMARGYLPLAAAPEPTPYRPRVVLWQLNRRCNLRCAFCDHWMHQDEMVYELGVRLIDEISTLRIPNLVLTGGEPFLHRRIFDLIRQAKSRCLGVNVTTNGTLLAAQAEEIRDSGVDSISVSLDGMAAAHDELRGRRGTYQRILGGLEALESAGATPEININTVVTSRNVQELSEVYRLTREHGYKFNFWPVNDSPSLHLQRTEDLAVYRQFVAQVLKQDEAFAGRNDYYAYGEKYHLGEAPPVRCLGVAGQLGVTYDGRVIPCCLWEVPELTLGHWPTRSLREVLAAPETRQAMERMEQHGCPAACFNHSLYEYTLATGRPFVAPRAEEA